MTIATKGCANFASPLRQYIWKGGTYVANLTDAKGNLDPNTGQEPQDTSPETIQNWLGSNNLTWQKAFLQKANAQAKKAS